MAEGRKYRFTWDLIGDLNAGRPNLGPQTRIEAYRLMQYCFRDILEKTYGTAAADRVFYDAGYLAGQHFFRHLLPPVESLKEFLRSLQLILKELKIGILRVEEADEVNNKFTVTVSEDLDCSGLPELAYEVCTYDEGFIAALMDSYTGGKYSVKEVDCWCTGDRTCRFRIEGLKEPGA